MRLSLKLVTENELELLMNWRMREDITRFMRVNPKLTLEGQKKWFRKLKNDKSQIRWIVWCNDVPIGSMYIVDIDYENSRCDGPGWFIAEKNYLSLKELIALQRNCIEFAFYKLGLNRIYGEIFSDNKGVIKLIKLCGFEIEGERKQHIKKEGIYYDMTMNGINKDQWERKKKQFSFDKIDIEYE